MHQAHGTHALSTKTLELSLPAPVALPYARFNAEPDPSRKLSHLLGAVEALLRTLCFVAAADLCSTEDQRACAGALLGGSFLERPTLGSWARMLTDLVERIHARGRPFVPELVDLAVDEDFVRKLGAIQHARNRMAHQGGHPIDRRVEEAQVQRLRARLHLLADQVRFLARYDLVGLGRAGPEDVEAVRLMGLPGQGGWRSLVVTASDQLEGLPTCLLLDPQHQRALALDPFLRVHTCSELTLGPALYVLAGAEGPPGAAGPGPGEWAYASVTEQDGLRVGQPGLSRGAWLQARLEEVRVYGPELAEPLGHAIAATTPRWTGRTVTGASGVTYRVGPRLGEGGAGVVYVGEGPDGSACALKFVRAGSHYDRRQAERFRRQLETVAGLGAAPGLVPILDHGRDQSVLGVETFTVQPLIRGGDLATRARAWGRVGAGGASLNERLALLCRVAAAVAHLHRHGLIHRDLKASNVVLDDDGAPLVTDFDLLRPVAPEDRERLTSVGTPLGTRVYMAPEQLQGSDDVGPPADVYALGLLTWETMLAELPRLAEARQAELARLSEAAGPEVAAIVERATRPSPRERFQDAEELLIWLERARSNGVAPSTSVAAGPVTTPAPLPAPSLPRGDAAQPTFVELPVPEQRRISAQLRHLRDGDYARLRTALPPGPPHPGSSALGRLVHQLSRDALHVKLDLAVHNRASLRAGVRRMLQTVRTQAAVYQAHASLLRPVLVAVLVGLCRSATSPELALAIRSEGRSLAADLGDDELDRALDRGSCL